MASFVMAFGIATSIIAMQSGFKQVDLGRGTTISAQIIQSEMERLRMMNWTQIFALSGTSSTFDGSTFFSGSSDIVGKYTVTRAVTPDGSRPTEVMNIGVSVRWQTYDGRWHRRTFTAIYAKNGLYDYFYTIAHP